ncbi:hypothetical protein TKK_0007722 [Trichogramma kaykai]
MARAKRSRKIDKEASGGLPMHQINDFLDKHFYGFKLYLGLAGFWLDQSPLVKSASKVWFSVVFAFIAATEFAGLYRARHDMTVETASDSMIETSMVLCTGLLYVLFQPVLIKMKGFLDTVVTDCQSILGSEEADVFMDFAMFYYKLAMIYLGLFMVIIPGAIVYPVVVPCLLNYLVPGNASFEPIVITQAYGGFENEDHLLVLIFILLNYAVAMTLCINACTGAFIFMIIFIVGKFKVLGWRLDKLHARLDDDRVVYSSVKRNEDLFYRHVAELIKDHASCYYFLDQIAALSSTLLFIALGLAVFGLTVSGAMIIIQFDKNREHCLKMGASACSALLTGFVLCFVGQVVTDSSDEIFDKAYATGWYKLPKRSRKLIFFMLMRSTKSSGIMGGFVKLNYETYNWIVSNSLSYITVMISLV